MDNRLYIFDASKFRGESDSVFGYDFFRFLSSLQGVVNRDYPRLFILYRDGLDKFWLDYISGEGKLLYGKEVCRIDNYIDILKVFADDIISCGLVLWDIEVYATMNAAVTACSIYNYLPVCVGFFLELLLELFNPEIKLNLTGKFTGDGIIFNTGRASTGSAKNDVYIYMLENFMDKTSDCVMGYVLDGYGRKWLEEKKSKDFENAFAGNVDYLIYKRAFIFDLCPWNDEAPCDDINQKIGTDYNTFTEIMLKQAQKNGNSKITSVTGFTPWQAKYTSHDNKSRYGGVETEWRHAELLSAYNCIMDADAYGYCGLFNASVYCQYKLKDKYINTKSKNEIKYNENKSYVLIYMGDYDSAVWLSIHVPIHFSDKTRGTTPLFWCFNPNLAARVPMVFDYVYENKTENDFFGAGDSGAGYLNPSLLMEPRIYSDLPDADKLFIEHNKYWFDKFDIDHVGFIINGNHDIKDNVYQMYSEFTKGGAGHLGNWYPVKKCGETVFMGHLSDLPGIVTRGESFDTGKFNEEDINRAAEIIIHFNKEKIYKNLMIFRTILWSPTMVEALKVELKLQDPDISYEFLNPCDFFKFAKEIF